MVLRLQIVAALSLDALLFWTLGPRWGCLMRFIVKTALLLSMASTAQRLLELLFRRVAASPILRLLVQMALMLSLSVHTLACICNAVSTPQMLGALHGVSPYLLCVYYVVTVVTTTGYGDITPRTTPQIVFTLGLIVCGSMMYAGTIGTISSWVGSTYSRILEHFNQLNEIRAFCANKKLDEELSAKLLLAHSESFNQRAREQTMRLFPTRLQKQCSFELYGAYVRSFEYFAALSEAQWMAIVRNIRTQTYLKGDVLLSRGDLNDRLMIVLTGKVFLVKYKESAD